MKARILLSGDELVEGRLADSNGSYIARRLTESGFDVVAFDVIGDDLERLVAAMSRSLVEVEATVVSGGLGGTADDLTRDALARVLGVGLVQVPEARAHIEAFWQRLGRPQPQTEPVEALMPEGARAVHNAIGLAPGILAERGGHRLLCLPGVPSELKRMIADGALSLLGRPAHVRRESLHRIVGLAESKIAEMLGERLDRGRNPLYGIAAKSGEVQLAVRVNAVDAQVADAMLEVEASALRGLFGERLLSSDGRSVEEVVRDLLERKGASLALAESLTGGLIGQKLTALPGVSSVFLGGVVAYANKAKVALLGVPSTTLTVHGAVSEETARAMAGGAVRAFGADWGLATTGIAGPSGATETKPVGLVWVAVAGPGGTRAESRIFPGDRDDVRNRAALHGLDLLRRMLAEP